MVAKHYTGLVLDGPLKGQLLTAPGPTCVVGNETAPDRWKQVQYHLYESVGSGLRTYKWSTEDGERVRFREPRPQRVTHFTTFCVP
jgi:hypothetical protein